MDKNFKIHQTVRGNKSFDLFETINKILRKYKNYILYLKDGVYNTNF